MLKLPNLYEVALLRAPQFELVVAQNICRLQGRQFKGIPAEIKQEPDPCGVVIIVTQSSSEFAGLQTLCDVRGQSHDNVF